MGTAATGGLVDVTQQVRGGPTQSTGDLTAERSL